MKINDLCKEAYDVAKEKGWYKKPISALERHMLMVSELAEATEEVRNNTPPVNFGKLPEDDDRFITLDHKVIIDLSKLKPEGELIELADVVIRIADYCGAMSWDLEEAIRIKMEYNKTRTKRHGGKLY